MEFSKPSLIEPSVRVFTAGTLKHCKRLRDEYYSYIFNMGSFLLFIFVLFGLLYYKYKGKLTPAEKEKKETEKKHYILSTIKKYQTMKQKSNNELITGLPEWYFNSKDKTGFCSSFETLKSLINPSFFKISAIFDLKFDDGNSTFL